MGQNVLKKHRKKPRCIPVKAQPNNSMVNSCHLMINTPVLATSQQNDDTGIWSAI